MQLMMSMIQQQMNQMMRSVETNMNRSITEVSNNMMQQVSTLMSQHEAELTLKVDKMINSAKGKETNDVSAVTLEDGTTLRDYGEEEEVKVLGQSVKVPCNLPMVMMKTSSSMTRNKSTMTYHSMQRRVV
jgi:hypothetical protein